MPSRTDTPPRTGRQLDEGLDSDSSASRASRTATHPATDASEDELVTEDSFRAIVSSHQRGGRWEVADEIEVRALFGEVTLDFTHADLPPSGEVEIDALAVCGEIKIIVPHDAEVEIEGTPVLGSIEQQVRKRRTRERIRRWVTGEAGEEPPEPPYFHLDCRAILGSIKVIGR